jgi:glycosyltransferase involved in cell wall biosynthesis
MVRIRQRARFAIDFPRLAWELRRIYRDRTPAIIHTWLPHANITGLLAARAWPETRVIVTQCGGAGEELFYPFQIRVQRALLGRADHAISNSTDGVHALARWGVDKGSISLVGNGISPDRVALESDRDEVRDKLGICSDVPVVAVATRLNDRTAVQQKNLAGIVAAMERVRATSPEARLLVVGATCEQLARFQLDLPGWASTTGFVSRPADYLAASDVVAIPSRSEGMSNVACEALSLGLPVVTTDVGDHAALVEAAGGRRVPVGDDGALAAGLIEMLRAPPTPERVREVAAPRLTLDRMVEATSEVYRAATYQSNVRRRPSRTSISGS